MVPVFVSLVAKDRHKIKAGNADIRDEPSSISGETFRNVNPIRLSRGLRALRILLGDIVFREAIGQLIEPASEESTELRNHPVGRHARTAGLALRQNRERIGPLTEIVTVAAGEAPIQARLVIQTHSFLVRIGPIWIGALKEVCARDIWSRPGRKQLHRIRIALIRRHVVGTTWVCQPCRIRDEKKGSYVLA